MEPLTFPLSSTAANQSPTTHHSLSTATTSLSTITTTVTTSLSTTTTSHTTTTTTAANVSPTTTHHLSEQTATTTSHSTTTTATTTSHSTTTTATTTSHSTTTTAANVSPTTTHHLSEQTPSLEGKSQGAANENDPATASRSLYYRNFLSLLFAIPTFRALLFDFEDSKKGRACALVWKEFMFVAIAFAFNSVHIHKFALTLGGSRLVAIQLVLLIFLVIVFFMSRIRFWNSFIEEENKSELWGKDPRNRWIVDCCSCFKGLILSLYLSAATLVGVYSEEGDLYGNIAMGFLTLSLISYGVKYREFEDLGLSDAFLVLPMGMWAGPLKQSPWLPVYVVSYYSVIVIFRKSLPRSLKQFFPETSLPLIEMKLKLLLLLEKIKMRN